MVSAERGALYPAGDADALASAMAGMMGNRARIESLGRAARVYAETLCADQYDTLLAAYRDAGKRHGRDLV
jgi:hypothetical protein